MLYREPKLQRVAYSPVYSSTPILLRRYLAPTSLVVDPPCTEVPSLAVPMYVSVLCIVMCCSALCPVALQDAVCAKLDCKQQRCSSLFVRRFMMAPPTLGPKHAVLGPRRWSQIVVPGIRFQVVAVSFILVESRGVCLVP